MLGLGHLLSPRRGLGLCPRISFFQLELEVHTLSLQGLSFFLHLLPKEFVFGCCIFYFLALRLEVKNSLLQD